MNYVGQDAMVGSVCVHPLVIVCIVCADVIFFPFFLLYLFMFSVLYPIIYSRNMKIRRKQ